MAVSKKESNKKYRSTKTGQLHSFLGSAKRRSIENNVPFNITYKYLLSIATNECPIFKIPFVWGCSNLGFGKSYEGTPNLDRIVPELGYVIGNVAFISGRANRIKDNGTMREHYAIADWIWEHLNAKQREAASLSKGNYFKSEKHSEHGIVSSAGVGEDCDNVDHHCGADVWEDFDCCSETCSGDCVGCRDTEVGALELFKSVQGLRDTTTKVECLETEFRYLYRELRESSLALGADPGVSELSNRRIIEIQRQLDKTLQSFKKAVTTILSEDNTDGYADTAGPGGFVVPIRDFRFG